MDADTERDIVERLEQWIGRVDRALNQDLIDAMADAADEITRLRAQPSPRELDREIYMLKAALRRLCGAVKVGSANEIGDALDLATDVICATYEPPMGSLPKSDPWHARFEYEP